MTFICGHTPWSKNKTGINGAVAISIGTKFERLLVIGESPRSIQGSRMWECLCDCGSIRIVGHSNLQSGHTKSCGCLCKERTSIHNKNRILSKETLKRMADTSRKLVGEKARRWIADRSKIKTGERSLNDPLQKGWRKAVKNSDGWKCRIADENCNGRLEAHHILPWSQFPELRYSINNGITLCHAHHPRKAEDVAKLSPYFQNLVASRG